MKKKTITGRGYDMAKKHGVKTAVGLNAAAIIFLYSRFVTLSDYSSLKNWTTAQQKQLTDLQSQVSFLKGKLKDGPEIMKQSSIK